MTNRMKDAIEGLYAAVVEIPKPTNIEGCPCCIDRYGVDLLLSKPLRELPPDYLTQYASSVFLTVGDVGDFLFFLPRILEILVVDEEANLMTSPEVVAMAIRNGEPSTWSEKQRVALHEYFDAHFEELLDKNRAGSHLDEWLCSLGRLGTDLAPYLDRIMKMPDRLKELFEWNSECLPMGRLCSGFWDYLPEQERQVVEWFGSTCTQQALATAHGPS